MKKIIKKEIVCNGDAIYYYEILTMAIQEAMSFMNHYPKFVITKLEHEFRDATKDELKLNKGKFYYSMYVELEDNESDDILINKSCYQALIDLKKLLKNNTIDGYERKAIMLGINAISKYYCDGCSKCKYEEKDKDEYPCKLCRRTTKDYWSL